MKKSPNLKIIEKVKSTKFLGLKLIIWLIIIGALLVIFIFYKNGNLAGNSRYRVMFWQGKVNEHIDINTGTWQSDPDGKSGAEIDKLTYCQKFYPKTTHVTEYKQETIDSWHDVDNQGIYSSLRMSYLCVQE